MTTRRLITTPGQPRSRVAGGTPPSECGLLSWSVFARR